MAVAAVYRETAPPSPSGWGRAPQLESVEAPAERAFEVVSGLGAGAPEVGLD